MGVLARNPTVRATGFNISPHPNKNNGYDMIDAPRSTYAALCSIDMTSKAAFSLIHSEIRKLTQSGRLTKQETESLELLVDVSQIAANDINVLCEYSKRHL